VPGAPAYVRFGPFHRTAHALLMTSFLGLAATGLPLKYSHYEWAKQLAWLLGGFGSTGIWHRIFGVLMLGCLAVYVILLARRFREERRAGTARAGVLFSPDSPVPHWRDIRDFFRMVGWFLGLGPKPTFERWAYWEKFDFWGACSDVILIGTTGLVLWFPNLFCTFLPGSALNYAKVIHSTLALLATGFVFAIHFITTHFRAEKFPADVSVFTGLVSEEEFKHERPELFERLSREGELEKLRTEVPSRRHLWLITIGGLLAYFAGLALLAAMVIAALGG
jgi:cytochrome b subunit of formate dehydrogenase